MGCGAGVGGGTGRAIGGVIGCGATGGVTAVGSGGVRLGGAGGGGAGAGGGGSCGAAWATRARRGAFGPFGAAPVGFWLIPFFAAGAVAVLAPGSKTI
jgi:hypothetical protein